MWILEEISEVCEKVLTIVDGFFFDNHVLLMKKRHGGACAYGLVTVTLKHTSNFTSVSRRSLFRPLFGVCFVLYFMKFICQITALRFQNKVDYYITQKIICPMQQKTGTY